MKLILSTLIALSANAAFASHFFSCDVSAEVLEVKDVARFNDSATFHQDDSIDDHEQLVTLNITSMSGDDSCANRSAWAPVTLVVAKADQGSLKKGQALELVYKNVGDSQGSQIRWTLK